MTSVAGAQAPTLSLSFTPPATARLSWSSNFTTWQLKSTTNLSSPVWLPVTQTPTVIGNALVLLFPLTNQSRSFRLEQSASCVFKGTPTTIVSGSSSTLTWCPVAGTVYRLSPGPGVVTGGSRVVSPTITTLYTLTASNASGVIPNLATVIVTPASGCGFANVTNWNGTVNFSYAIAPPAGGGRSYSVNHQSALSVQLTRTSFSSTNAQFTGYATGTASMNDRVDDFNPTPPEAITIIGSGPLLSDPTFASELVLDIDCVTGTYSFTIAVQVQATMTVFGSPASLPCVAGTVTVANRALPLSVGTLSYSGTLPARGPLWSVGGDFYSPGDLVSDVMFFEGVVSDTTAGNATVSWSFVPAP